MSLLEDRITRILELRKSGKDETEIAEDMKLDVSVVQGIEEFTTINIQNLISSGNQQSIEIAKDLGLSAIVVDMFRSHYMVEYEDSTPIRAVIDNDIIDYKPETSVLQLPQDPNDNTPSIREANYNLIRQAISDGATSVKEVIDFTGFKRPHLNKLARNGNIELPGRDYRSKKDKIDYIRQASIDRKHLDVIAEHLDVTRRTVVRYALEGNITLIGIDYRTHEDILNAFRIATKDGQSADIIAEYVGFSKKTVVKYASAANIMLLGVNYISKEFDLEDQVTTIRKRHKKTVEKVVAIREAYLNGSYTIDAIMDTTRMTKYAVEEYAPYAGINFSVRERKKKERLFAIYRAIANGADSTEAVSEQSGMGIPTIHRYAKEFNIILPGRDYRTRDEKIAAIQLAKEQGYTSLDKIAIQVQLSESMSYKLIKEAKIDLLGIGLPVRPGTKRRPELDKLINRRGGATLQEMANETHQSRETMRQYTGHTGQYQTRIKNRK